MTFALAILLLAVQPQNPGMKVTTRRSSPGGLTSEQTQYIKGDRRRSEFRNLSGSATKADGTKDINYGPHLASIQRCDLGLISKKSRLTQRAFEVPSGFRKVDVIRSRPPHSVFT